MRTLGMCLAGCGGMGRRHLRGYAALAAAGLWNARLVAVFDVRPEPAQAVAAEAEQQLGYRPRVHTTLESVLQDPDLDAVDVVTEPAHHHTIAVPALRSGRHVLCEKPLSLTIRGCQLMIDAARAGNAVLATAENYRRGGPNRLARAVIDAGLLGRIHLMVQHLLGGDDRVLITPWRHQKATGTIALDMGVHLTDLIEFYLGPIESAYGRALIAEPVRRTADGASVTATGEDTLLAQLHTASGAEVQLAYLPSGPGHRYVQRTIHGTSGSMYIPPDRTDGDIQVRLADGVLGESELRAALGPAGALDGATRTLLGPRGTGGDADFGSVDAGYLAVEIADFVSAVLNGHPPEVEGIGGMRAVAGILAMMESTLLGRPVNVDDVCSGAVSRYQDDIDVELGLTENAEALSE